MTVVLHNYFRSSTSFRVRAALAMKGIEFEYQSYHLRLKEHRADCFIRLNPQGLVPVLEIDGEIISQSIAILEYLDERFPTPALLPKTALERARVRSLALLVGCDIHPLNNLRVLNYLGDHLGADDEQVATWFRYWVAEGFEALESRLQNESATGTFCHGESIGLADICLCAQVVNNKRFDVQMKAYPKIMEIFDACMQYEAFQHAMPMVQPDAE
jgi:maleylpyruvate isomerase